MTGIIRVVTPKTYEDKAASCPRCSSSRCLCLSVTGKGQGGFHASWGGYKIYAGLHPYVVRDVPEEPEVYMVRVVELTLRSTM